MINESAKENLTVWTRTNNEWLYSDPLISDTKQYKASIRDLNDVFKTDFTISISGTDLLMELTAVQATAMLTPGESYVYDLVETVGGVDNRILYGSISVRKGVTIPDAISDGGAG